MQEHPGHEKADPLLPYGVHLSTGHFSSTERRPSLNMHTSLLIPCFNEADGIPHLCQRLRALMPLLCRTGSAEVVFVDDGSTDGTAGLIREHAADLPHRILTHERNRGLGAALKTGFAESEADRIVTMDSDCTYDPMQVPKLLALLDEGYDIVTGSPYHPKGEVVGVPSWRLLLSKSLSWVYWVVLPKRLYTYTSCFRAYRKEILPRLQADSDGFLCVSQLLVSGILQGARVVELPTRLTTRQFGQSKMRILQVILSHLGYLRQVVSTRLTGRRQVAPVQVTFERGEEHFARHAIESRQKAPEVGV